MPWSAAIAVSRTGSGASGAGSTGAIAGSPAARKNASAPPLRGAAADEVRTMQGGRLRPADPSQGSRAHADPAALAGELVTP